MKLQLKRSNVLEIGAAKEPTAAQMEYGELAVNYNSSDPAVFIKDSNDNIIRIAGSGNIGSGDTPSGPDKPSTGNDVGDLFFDTVNNTLYYWNGTEWVPIEANKNENIFVGTLAEVDFYLSPQSRPEGFLWWNVEDETLYVWYNNNGSPEWRPASPSSGDGGASVTISDTPPSTGASNIGDLWWDSSDGRLYIYYEDDSSAQWVDASPKGDSIEDAPADGNQYARKDNNWTVVTSSGGGGTGDTVINYNGASAWGKIATDGTLDAGLNCNVTRTGTGTYVVAFQTPMPSADYSVNTASYDNGNVVVYVQDITATGFTLISVASGSGSVNDYGAMFTVFATNALPPRGGTGTDAWLTTSDNEGTIGGSFNIASVTKTTTGTYDVVFTTPMPTPNYAVTGNVSLDNTTTYVFKYINKTTTGFTALVAFPKLSSNTMVLIDLPFSCTVNATNAQLPDTVTQEQIEAAINNPGASAWGNVEAKTSNGLCTINGGTNVASVTRTAVGKYAVVFNTPMPAANYAVQLTCINDTGARQASVNDVTTTGFTAQIFSSAGAATDKDFTFTVFATNALPPRGTTGTDAWGTCQADGTLDASFNTASVTRTSQGVYDVVFTTPMPSADYSVNASTVYTGATPTTNLTYIGNQTATGFEIAIYTYSSGAKVDSEFNFSVNATNATLPTTFTEEEIQAVVDLAKSGSANGASAWASVQSDGTIDASLNVESVTKTATGTYDVVFTSPLPSSSYAVAANIMEDANASSTKFALYYNLTTTGFSIKTKGGSTFADLNFSFSVHATNVQLPLTVTQTQIESFKSTVTALESAVTRINAIEANEIVDDATDSALLTLIASLTTKVQSLESKIQTIEADHTTLMNNNGGY